MAKGRYEVFSMRSYLHELQDRLNKLDAEGLLVISVSTDDLRHSIVCEKKGQR